ncbi:hypothetical protein [Actinoallomurus sp. NPDC052274]|uniref:phage distal tail protein n=1 Tax=Actinoallomurus sp. NPDC052274 TaxID=3155420 RepID=UPI003413DF62
MTIPIGQPNAPLILELAFYNEEAGLLDDPSEVRLDITYGNEVGLVEDTAGPFFYAEGNPPAVPGTIWRTGIGQYAAMWQVPGDAATGIYVANWTCTYGPDGNRYLVTENINVLGGYVLPVASGDVGYWTGTLTYDAQGVSIPIGGVDEHGTAWMLKKIDGWDSAPAVGQVIQKSGDHGGWPVPQFYGPRIITLTLLASAKTQALRDVARAQLQQAVPVGDLALFRYDEPIPKQAGVRRNASANVTESYPTLVDCEFQIPLVAPDPRKYAAEVQTVTVSAASASIGLTVPFTVPATLPNQPPAGSMTVRNGGNFETPALITVTGPMPAPTVVNITTGQRISYSQLNLGATDRLLIDLDARQGYLNGGYRPADPYSSWWRLQPGDNLVQLSGLSAGGAASMTVQWRNAYI